MVPSVNNASLYGLCTVFLPGNTHLVLGTREGHLLVLDIAAGDVAYVEENAHDGAIWSIDMRRPTTQQPSVALVTGSADNTVKFWDLKTQEDSSAPMLVHSRTLEMSDDVIAVRYSHSVDPTKRMVFVSTLDSTIKVFFDDTLKFFLSLYGHKLPALAVDASDDDVLLASSGADKTIKIWGLDFGDTHRTLHGHEDSVTDLRFVRRTHNFFTTSKDGTVRYWDGDRFEMILVLNGHFAEVSCLSISRTGAFVMTGGLDRQVRVWERTKDIVFLEEERERELEQMFDDVGREEDTTGKLMLKRGEENDDDEDPDRDNEPQSEAAVKRSVLSVAAGDRIMEALERADQEKKEAAAFRQKNPGKEKTPNPLLLGMDPAPYFLWVLKSVKEAELEQSLLVLPLGHVERVLYYLILLLRKGRGVEICARVSVFLVKTHQHQVRVSCTNRRWHRFAVVSFCYAMKSLLVRTWQRYANIIRVDHLYTQISEHSAPHAKQIVANSFGIVPEPDPSNSLFSCCLTELSCIVVPGFSYIQIMSNRSTVVPLRELRRLLRERLTESRDTIGFNLAALRAVGRTAAGKKEGFLDHDGGTTKNIWAGMGLGSDLAAALESRRPRRR